MVDYKQICEDFLQDFKKTHDVLGALVCGSYVTGNPSDRSDIDLHIVLSESSDYRERGNLIRDGILLEYFANPPQQLTKYFEDDFKKGPYMSLAQFATGEIISDSTGKVNELVQTAKSKLQESPAPLTDVKIEPSKYGLWDLNDNVQDTFETDSDSFSFVYYNALFKLFTVYAEFLRYPVQAFHQVFKVLMSKTKRDKYLLKDFPDMEFVNLFIEANKLINQKEQAEIFNKLTEYTLTKMGGFKIDGWSLKSPLDL